MFTSPLIDKIYSRFGTAEGDPSLDGHITINMDRVRGMRAKHAHLKLQTKKNKEEAVWAQLERRFPDSPENFVSTEGHHVRKDHFSIKPAEHSRYRARIWFTNSETGNLELINPLHCLSGPSRPLLQNAMGCFMPEPGRTWVAVDFPRLEREVIANLTRNETLIQACQAEDYWESLSTACGQPKGKEFKQLVYQSFYGKTENTPEELSSIHECPLPMEDLARRPIPYKAKHPINSAIQFTATSAIEHHLGHAADCWTDCDQVKFSLLLADTVIWDVADDIAGDFIAWGDNTSYLDEICTLKEWPTTITQRALQIPDLGPGFHRALWGK